MSCPNIETGWYGNEGVVIHVGHGEDTSSYFLHRGYIIFSSKYFEDLYTDLKQAVINVDFSDEPIDVVYEFSHWLYQKWLTILSDADDDFDRLELVNKLLVFAEKYWIFDLAKQCYDKIWRLFYSPMSPIDARRVKALYDLFDSKTSMVRTFYLRWMVLRFSISQNFQDIQYIEDCFGEDRDFEREFSAELRRHVRRLVKGDIVSLERELELYLPPPLVPWWGARGELANLAPETHDAAGSTNVGADGCATEDTVNSNGMQEYRGDADDPVQLRASGAIDTNATGLTTDTNTTGFTDINTTGFTTDTNTTGLTTDNNSTSNAREISTPSDIRFPRNNEAIANSNLSIDTDGTGPSLNGDAVKELEQLNPSETLTNRVSNMTSYNLCESSREPPRVQSGQRTEGSNPEVRDPQFDPNYVRIRTVDVPREEWVWYEGHADYGPVPADYPGPIKYEDGSYRPALHSLLLAERRPQIETPESSERGAESNSLPLENADMQAPSSTGESLRKRRRVWSESEPSTPGDRIRQGERERGKSKYTFKLTRSRQKMIDGQTGDAGGPKASEPGAAQPSSDPLSPEINEYSTRQRSGKTRKTWTRGQV